MTTFDESGQELTVVDPRRGRLLLSRRPEQRADPPDDVVASYPSRTDAMLRAIEWAGLSDGEVADTLKIDRGQWSRIKSGSAHFPTEKYKQFHEICGNTVLLRYDAISLGHGIHPLETEVERRLREEQGLRTTAENKLAYCLEIIKEMRG